MKSVYIVCRDYCVLLHLNQYLIGIECYGKKSYSYKKCIEIHNMENSMTYVFDNAKSGERNDLKYSLKAIFD